MQPEIIRPSQIPAIYGISKSTLYREIRRGNIPPPIKISDRLTGWRKSTLEKWLRNREGAK